MKKTLLLIFMAVSLQCKATELGLDKESQHFHLAKEKYSSKVLAQFYPCDGNALINIENDRATLTTLSYFGTSINITLYQAASEQAEAILCNALAVIQDYHYLASNYAAYSHVTNVKTINQAPTLTHHIDPQLTDLIATSIDWHQESQGYFNVALSPVISLWRKKRFLCQEIPGECELPSEQSLRQAAQYIDISNITLDRQNNTITMTEGMSIDLGGIAKGWMVEKLFDQLRRDGAEAFMINAGGNIRHYGEHPSGRSFITAIEDPVCKQSEYTLEKCQTQEGLYHEVIAGENLTVVSSGNYLRYFEVNGKQYHHIIDPNTLYPEKEGVAVTVILSSHHIYADIISTMLFLMPVEQGLKYVNERPWIEAVWYLNKQGDKIKSANFNKYKF
ncbi:FAD:protein FMN transferase [Shewanella insulae]|uniref:FAD:protein FMN transferase n=1 Tax=Shewanella insulae TaxID=2681496 RepID=UPI001EFE8FB0|nr:FAD:protein FMN transferase [Shewanella insulae]MCG9736655.1 FAD:protein FMN transferase [Shewanella insulae]